MFIWSDANVYNGAFRPFEPATSSKDGLRNVEPGAPPTYGYFPSDSAGSAPSDETSDSTSK